MFAGLAAARPITWDLESLIQEIMMALVGYTGDVFVDSNNKDPRYQQLEPCAAEVACAQVALLLHRHAGTDADDKEELVTACNDLPA
jgi:hypothetical protein